MTRTVTALFDSRPEAESAKQRLSASQIDADNIRIIDKEGGSSSDTGGQGFWASLKEIFIADEDRHAYGEGINRGSYLLCAEVDEDQADEAIRILDESNSVDFDQRQDEWRSSGWTPYEGSTGSAMFRSEGATGTGASALGTAGGLGTATSGMPLTAGTQGYENRERSSTVSEEHIPIVEEELRVGKREVNRGGARVRSYVREVPIHEQVNLRDEHVSVERRPVDRPLGAGDLDRGDMFQERNIEMTETAEEPVVAKEAKVREEVVLRKTAEEHSEDIDDTVRRTEIEVDEDRTGSAERSPFFGDGNRETGASDDEINRADYERTERDRRF